LRKVTNFAATMGLIAATVAGPSQYVSAANRGELWFVVHDMCLPAYRSIGVAFPCAEINIANGLDRGFAVLQAPSSAAHVIVVPTTRISGIERPALQSENAPNYWEAASDARSFVEQGARRHLLRIGSSRKRIAPPAGFGERTQAGANATAEQFDKLCDGEIEKRAGSRGLELVGQPPAEKSFDERPAERTQMIAAGRGPVWIADQMKRSASICISTMFALSRTIGRARRSAPGGL
jgi:hypothetical protein